LTRRSRRREPTIEVSVPGGNHGSPSPSAVSVRSRAASTRAMIRSTRSQLAAASWKSLKRRSFLLSALAVARAAVLSNEKFRGVRLQLDATILKIETQNPDQEEAQEEVEVSYQGTPLEIGFNVNYLLDALDAINSDEVVIELRSADASGLLYDPQHKENKYVVMPMRL